MPNGVAIPVGGITFDWLARLCATLIHVSTVEHDILNNVVWNYSTFGWLIPTVVPLSGEPMDERRAFDMVATLIGTWKPYNMLLTSDVPALALDERAAAVMKDWIEELNRIQNEMDATEPRDPALSYPAYLNVSISNWRPPPQKGKGTPAPAPPQRVTRRSSASVTRTSHSCWVRPC